MNEKNLKTYLTETLPNEKEQLTSDIIATLETEQYRIAEVNVDKPWGSYIRIESDQADAFVHEFFPGLSPEEARLGMEGAELSPKILIVSPGQRLSWQYHNRRAERWTFLTEGAYNKSMTDDEGERVIAHPGDVVQFAKGERHRLNGIEGSFVVVAEIWQHTDTDAPSNEVDIIRLQDDYAR
jgi:mannose-6-phosphate isomerase-like protein (cupin superfamily)